MGKMKDLFEDWTPPPPEEAVEGLEDVPLEVRQHFERLSLEVARRGYSRYSSDAILHRIRWHYHIEKGDAEFKCNNNWTASLARWFMNIHPELGSFFETRIRKSITAEEI